MFAVARCCRHMLVFFQTPLTLQQARPNQAAHTQLVAHQQQRHWCQDHPWPAACQLLPNHPWAQPLLQQLLLAALPLWCQNRLLLLPQQVQRVLLPLLLRARSAAPAPLAGWLGHAAPVSRWLLLLRPQLQLVIWHLQPLQRLAHERGKKHCTCLTGVQQRHY